MRIRFSPETELFARACHMAQPGAHIHTDPLARRLLGEEACGALATQWSPLLKKTQVRQCLGWFPARAAWLEAALNLYDFMNAHQFAPNGKLYHHMNREGSPCRPDPRAGEWPSARGDGQSYGLHDESFAVMGLAELYKATGREDIKQSLYKRRITHTRMN